MTVNDTNLNIRINAELKDMFIKATNKNNIKYSKVLRKFIEEYVDENK